MPFLAPIIAFLAANAPAITAASAIAGTSVGIGEAIANSGGSSASTTTPTTPTAPPTPTGTTTPAQVSSLAQTFPSLQQNLGGSVSPDYYMQMMQLLSGQSNQPGSNNAALEALKQIQGGGTSGGLTTQPVVGG